MKAAFDLIKPTGSPRKENCPDHGEFETKNLFSNVWSKCPQCEDAREAEMRRIEAEKERAEKNAAWERRLGSSGIPERFRDRTLDTFVTSNDQQNAALAFCRHYADEFDDVLKTGRSALFIGQPGTGKTHLAVGIGQQIMRSKRSFLFTSVQKMIMRLRSTWSRDSNETELAAIENFAYPDLLVIDEVGVQLGSEMEKNQFFSVMNERYERRKPTILISNLSTSDVKLYLGTRIYDRLREDKGEFIGFDWESHRGKL